MTFPSPFCQWIAPTTSASLNRSASREASPGISLQKSGLSCIQSIDTLVVVGFGCHSKAWLVCTVLFEYPDAADPLMKESGDVESEQTNVLPSSWFNHSRLQTLNGGSIQLAHSLLNTPFSERLFLG